MFQEARGFKQLLRIERKEWYYVAEESVEMSTADAVDKE